MIIAMVFQCKKISLHFSIQMLKQVCLCSGFGWGYYGSVRVMWVTLTTSVLGLLLRSLSQENICNRSPFHLSHHAATVIIES